MGGRWGGQGNNVHTYEKNVSLCKYRRTDNLSLSLSLSQTHTHAYTHTHARACVDAGTHTHAHTQTDTRAHRAKQKKKELIGFLEVEMLSFQSGLDGRPYRLL